MKEIKTGSKVTVHYIGTLDDGRTFDSTPDDRPLVFTVGANEVFPALEQAVIGMTVGEVRNLSIPAADAYGPRLAENMLTLDRSNLPEGKEILVGQKLAVEFKGNQSRVMVIARIADDTITLDGNHQLAGFDLHFALRLDAVD